MKNLEIYCVTDKPLKYLNKTGYILGAVGKNKFPKNYIKCNFKKNIFFKEKYYSELTFHYWFWKNELKNKKKITGSVFAKKEDFGYKKKK